LENNIKIDEYFKNYGVFFIEADKNDKNKLNAIFSLKNVAEIEECLK
jgi:hypothetical protein